MKNLTKCFLVILISVISFQINAQTTTRLKGGLNLATQSTEVGGDFKMNPGFHAGFAVDIPLADFLSLEPGLLFETKGTKYSTVEQGIPVEIKMHLFYVDMPLVLKGIYDFGNNKKVYVAFGGYFGVGLFGKIKASATYQGESETIKMTVPWGDGGYSRIDGGLEFGGGFELNKFLIGVSYDLGLANLEDAGTRNRVFKISIGFIY